MTTALEGGVGSASRPGRSLPPGKDLVPIVQEAGWAPGPVWTGAENLASPGFDHRTFQPVASRYTDYATRPTFPFSRLYTYTFLLLRILCRLLSRKRVSKSDIKSKVVRVRDLKALAGVEVGSNFNFFNPRLKGCVLSAPGSSHIAPDEDLLEPEVM